MRALIILVPILVTLGLEARAQNEDLEDLRKIIFHNKYCPKKFTCILPLDCNYQKRRRAAYSTFKKYVVQVENEKSGAIFI